jgi:hypothetical protein
MIEYKKASLLYHKSEYAQEFIIMRKKSNPIKLHKIQTDILAGKKRQVDSILFVTLLIQGRQAPPL